VWIDVLALYVRLVRAGFDRHASYGAASPGRHVHQRRVRDAPGGRAARGARRVGLLGHGGGYDTATTVTYVWLGQGLLAVVSLWTDGELAERVAQR